MSLEWLKPLSDQIHGRPESKRHKRTPTGVLQHPGSGVDEEHFVRKSLKYWVRPNDVPTLVASIARHLPVYIFGDGSGPVEAQVNSVYFERDDFQTYNDRMSKLEGSMVFRARWYSEM